MGNQLKVVKDHNALKALVSKASLEGCLSFWADFLINFNSEISWFYKRVFYKTDASQVGLGAVLTQKYKIEGKKYLLPVTYTSRSLKGAKRKYSVTYI